MKQLALPAKTIEGISPVTIIATAVALPAHVASVLRLFTPNKVPEEEESKIRVALEADVVSRRCVRLLLHLCDLRKSGAADQNLQFVVKVFGVDLDRHW